MKLKLFYFAPPHNLHTIRWLSAFVRIGHEVHLATTDVDAGREISGVIVHDMNVNRARPGPLRFMRRWKKVRDILRAVSPDVVHGHCVTWSGGYAAYFRQRPLVMTAWGSDVLVEPTKSMLNWLLIRWRLGRCDLVTVDSEDLKRAVMTFGIQEDRIAVVQWGVHVERLRSFRGSSRLRQLTDVSPTTLIVLSTRRLEPICNVEILIRAIPRVLSGTPRKVCFVFVGDGSLRYRLESLARDFGVDSHVRFVGHLSHENLEECYGGADIYVSVPESDSTSVSLLEAMAAALPAVVSDVPSNLEWIRDGWNGYIVKRGDPDALADALLRLIADETARRVYGARSAAITVERADHLASMRKMEEIYRAAIESARRVC